MEPDEPMEFPIDGILDLHTFQAKEVRELVPGYIEECLKRNILEIRVIHGKGSGTLKRLVRSLLEKDPHVAGFRDAGLEEGGWGATIVSLKKEEA